MQVIHVVITEPIDEKNEQRAGGRTLLARCEQQQQRREETQGARLSRGHDGAASCCGLQLEMSQQLNDGEGAGLRAAGDTRLWK